MILYILLIQWNRIYETRTEIEATEIVVKEQKFKQ